MLNVTGLARRFGDVVALDGVTFSVPDGALVGFVGRNGAGKTTAMRVIMGMVAPDAGEVAWRGATVDRAARLRFGYMPEERGLYPKMGVAEQLVYFGRMSGLDRRTAVSLVQLAALVAGGLAAVAISPDLSIPPGLAGASGMIFVWFMLAYAIFGALFSIAGSITARQEDMQQKLMPAMYGLFVVFAFAFVAFNSPDSTVATVASFVPLTAPAVVPLLDAIVGLPGWHIVLSMLSTLLGAVAALWVSGAVYAGGALRLRGKTTMREALTSARGERARAAGGI